MKPIIENLKWKNVRTIALALLCAMGSALILGGCADQYGGAYYAPDYGSYYGSYGYGGGPYYYGYDSSYYGAYNVGGVRHSRYYGGHHFAHDFGGNAGRGNSAPHASGPGAAHVGGGGGGGHGGGHP